MPWLATVVLVLWLPVVFYIFERYRPQKAIVFSFVTAWLFLPPTQIPLPGLPDWSKMSATVVSVCLCAWLKEPQQILGFKLRWYDLPVLVYCLCPFVSSITNGQGVYDGLSAVLEETLRWALPYLIGRMFLADVRGNRQLCLGIAVGGLLYIPFCLFEIRMSPVLKLVVYGFAGGVQTFALRYSGYRPTVFLSHGLELGWWMCCATLASYQLWVSKSAKHLYGYPMSVLLVSLGLVTVACKSTGALLQLALGFVLIYVSRYTKSTVLVWALMSLAPIYCVTRPLGLLSGDQFVSLASSIFGGDRAQSLEYRFDQEQVLMKSALERPVFGWSRNAGFNPPGANGRTAVTDGLWIIVFGWMGYVGLAALNAMLLIPTALFIVRFRPKTWQDFDVAPITTLAIILPLFMLDNLSNAMLNPIYAIAMGSVSGCIPIGQNSGEKHKRERLRSIGYGKQRQAAELPDLTSQISFGHDYNANQSESEAFSADRDDLGDEADDLYKMAIRHRQSAIDTEPTSGRVDALAKSHVLYARFLTKLGQLEYAVVERDRAVNLWRSLIELNPTDEFSRDVYATNLNDLAWLLLADQELKTLEIDRAVLLSEEAVLIGPDIASFWNTLGIAHYRRHDYYKAIHSLSRSIRLSSNGGNAFDFYYLAMANHALGYPKPALDWFNRAELWVQRNPQLVTILISVRNEARQTIG